MSADHYDIIVAGTGSMGSAACYYLAKSGLKVLGIDASGQVPHDRGSHGGQSRIIRKAYFEEAAYVPLLERAYENWQQLESLTGETVYVPNGLLYKGPPDHPLIRGVKEAADRFHIPLQSVSGTEYLQHFSQREDDVCLFEPDAGFLLPDNCIRLYLEEAEKLGARFVTGEPLQHWKKVNGNIQVTTSKRVLSADRLLITSGAGAAALLKEMQVPLRVTRQVLLWVRPEQPRNFHPSHFPCWMQAAAAVEGVWYGFPFLPEDLVQGPSGLKLALHYPADETSLDTVNREVSPSEAGALLQQAGHYFLPARSRPVAAQTCLYTMTPDEHFIIDFLPGYDKEVMIACGFSGHGFKFASVIGEILADMAIRGRTDLPVSFLSLSRFMP